MLLYVISVGETGPCKVGYGRDPRKRLKNIQIGNHLKLHLASIWKHPQKPAEMCEREIHIALKAKYIRGEWFNATPAEIEAIASVIGMTQIPEANGNYDFTRKPKPGDTRLSWLI